MASGLYYCSVAVGGNGQCTVLKDSCRNFYYALFLAG